MDVTHIGRSLAAGPAHHSQSVISQKKQAGVVTSFDEAGRGSTQSRANVEQIRHVDISLYNQVETYPEQSKINEMLSVSYYV